MAINHYTEILESNQLQKGVTDIVKAMRDSRVYQKQKGSGKGGDSKNKWAKQDYKNREGRFNVEKGVTLSSRYLNKEEAKISKKKPRNVKKEQDIKDIRNSIIQSEIEDNEKIKRELKQQLKKKQTKIEEATTYITQLQKKIHYLSNQNQITSRLLDQQQRQSQELKSLLKKEKNLRHIAQYELHKSKAQLNHMKFLHQSQQKRKKEAQENVEQLEQELSSLKKKYKELQRKFSFHLK